MARIRSIKPEFFTSLAIVELSTRARLTFIGLWTHVDDDGRCVDDARLVRAALWPLDDMTNDDVEVLLVELAKHGRIVRYQAGGRPYLQVIGWEHQKIDRRRASEIPPPTDDERTLVEPSTSPRRSDDETSSPDLGILGSGSRDLDLTPLSPSATSTAVQAVFDAWTESTGRKRSVLDTKRRKIITRALKAHPTEDVLDAVRGWRHSPHHRGENDRHTVYNDLELILRDCQQIEKFRDLERQDPALRAPATNGRSTPYRAKPGEPRQGRQRHRSRPVNADEIVTTIDVLQSAWPWVEWSEKTQALWCDALSDLDAGVALHAARAVVHKLDRPPSIAVFLAEAHSEFERRRGLPSGRAELSTCRECDGSGWVLVDATGHGTYRRCSVVAMDPARHRRPPPPSELDIDAVGRLRILQLMRKATAAAKAKGEHHHGGPDPCPVCGGLRPDLRDATV